MIRLAALFILVLGAALAGQGEQTTPPGDESEEAHFSRVMADAGPSPVDYVRALEAHLRKFPDTPRHAIIERSIAQAAIEAGDNARLVRYGESVLGREPNNLRILQNVTGALLASDGEENARKALNYARHYESALKIIERNSPPAGPSAVRLKLELDESMGKALVYQARAAGNLGNLEEAVSLARKSYAANPAAESAREAGRWLARLGRFREAVAHLADAFATEDPDNTREQRALDRERLKELYLKTHDSEAGLGDLILEAYDRTTATLQRRHEALKLLDPNFGLTDPLEFSLSGLDGEKFDMSSVRGKVVVLDFWATWCGPCRVQQPMYEEVKRKFAGHSDVAFLNVSTDEDRSVVGPFVERQNWNKTVYFEDGLSRLLDVSSIPTTIILDKQGQIASRMIGFVPERFVGALTERIERALAGD